MRCGVRGRGATAVQLSAVRNLLVRRQQAAHPLRLGGHLGLRLRWLWPELESGKLPLAALAAALAALAAVATAGTAAAAVAAAALAALLALQLCRSSTSSPLS